MKTTMIQKIELINESAKNKQVPNRPTNLPKKVCAYCNYKKECAKYN
jgi:hypothetical protein